MYPVFLAIHNILRWVALILAIYAFFRALFGWLGKKDYVPADRKVAMFTSMALDIQILFGLILYIFISPITRAAMLDFGAAMKQADLRFFALEHGFYMLLAVVFAHLGSILPRKTSDMLAKHKRAAIWLGLALVLILLGMPWARPLFPGLV